MSDNDDQNTNNTEVISDHNSTEDLETITSELVNNMIQEAVENINNRVEDNISNNTFENYNPSIPPIPQAVNEFISSNVNNLTFDFLNAPSTNEPIQPMDMHNRLNFFSNFVTDHHTPPVSVNLSRTPFSFAHSTSWVNHFNSMINTPQNNPFNTITNGVASATNTYISTDNTDISNNNSNDQYNTSNNIYNIILNSINQSIADISNNIITTRRPRNRRQLMNTILSSLHDKSPCKKVLSDEGNDQLLKLKYNPEINGEHTTCPILQKDFQEGDELIKLPCGHMFFPDAINHWLKEFNASCPVCRHELKNKEVIDHESVEDVRNRITQHQQDISHRRRRREHYRAAINADHNIDSFEDYEIQLAIMASLNDMETAPPDEAPPPNVVSAPAPTISNTVIPMELENQDDSDPELPDLEPEIID